MGQSTTIVTEGDEPSNEFIEDIDEGSRRVLPQLREVYPTIYETDDAVVFAVPADELDAILRDHDVDYSQVVELMHDRVPDFVLEFERGVHGRLDHDLPFAVKK